MRREWIWLKPRSLTQHRLRTPRFDLAVSRQSDCSSFVLGPTSDTAQEITADGRCLDKFVDLGALKLGAIKVPPLVRSPARAAELGIRRVGSDPLQCPYAGRSRLLKLFQNSFVLISILPVRANRLAARFFHQNAKPRFKRVEDCYRIIWASPPQISASRWTAPVTR